MRQNWQATDYEIAFIREQFDSSPIQSIILAQGEDGLDAAAALICQALTAKFVTPYPGESREQFRKRQRNATPAQRAKVSQLPPESQEHWEKRVNERMPRVSEAVIGGGTSLHLHSSISPNASEPGIAKARRAVGGLHRCLPSPSYLAPQGVAL